MSLKCCPNARDIFSHFTYHLNFILRRFVYHLVVILGRTFESLAEGEAVQTYRGLGPPQTNRIRISGVGSGCWCSLGALCYPGVARWTGSRGAVGFCWFKCCGGNARHCGRQDSGFAGRTRAAVPTQDFRALGVSSRGVATCSPAQAPVLPRSRFTSGCTP